MAVTVTIAGRNWPTATCRSCGAPMVWAFTVKDKPIPLDVVTYLDGNLVVAGVHPGDSRGEAPAIRYLKRDEDPGPVPRYKTHFATCPNAGAHRRK